MTLSKGIVLNILNVIFCIYYNFAKKCFPQEEFIISPFQNVNLNRSKFLYYIFVTDKVSSAGSWLAAWLGRGRSLLSGMTMEKYLMFRFVCGAMVLYNVVLGESSETVGGSLSAILNAQLLSNHNQPPATTKMNHNMHIANQMKEHIARKITHSAHILNHGKTHIPGNITPNANSQTKANEQLPAKIHQNVHIKSQGNDHIQGGKIPHNTHIQSPEKKHLPGKITRNAHTPSQEKQHLPGQITHNAHVQNHEKKHIPVPVQSERHTDNVNHGNTRNNLDHNAEKVRPSKSTSQSKNKTVPQVGNVKEQLLAKSTETKPNSQADVNDLNAAAKAIQEEALNIPVTIRIMFPHYIQVKNKWYPLKLRFGVPQP